MPMVRNTSPQIFNCSVLNLSLGTVDYVAKEIVGGDLDEMPRGYFMTPQFIGTVVATCAASICAYLGWVLPANTL